MQLQEGRDPARIRALFGGIAHRYDLLNHLLSANLDRRWRRAAARRVAGGQAARVLDLCGGTGDLALDIARAGGTGLVVCCDFSHPMLLRAARKFERKGVAARCVPLEADGLRLPFPDRAFDAVSIAFGVRNLRSLGTGLAEIHRVLGPRGRLVVLEFSQPTRRWLARVYGLYLRRVLPHLGDHISGREGAYGYLARTISEFPEPPALAGQIRAAGFRSCDWTPLAGGIVAIHVAHKDGVARAQPLASNSRSSAF